MPVCATVDPVEPEPAVIGLAADRLRAGGIVAYPTETLYGLAVDPRCDAAVERLFQVKGRIGTAAIPLIAASTADALEVGTFGPAARRLARACWPGPLTIVVPAAPWLSHRLLGGQRTVGVRVPAHAVARALTAALGAPITSTSANRSGQPPARRARDVVDALGDAVDLVLDGGDTPGGPPSTLVEIVGERPVLLRSGATPWNRVLESLE
jgi:L-threonylcarbamoyladenylate synthase